MKFFGVSILYMFFVFQAFANNDARDWKFAKNNHKEIFTPGNVSVLKIDGVDSFVFTGASPRINKTETTLELYNEASLVAKQTLYKHLTKDIKENVSIQMSKAYILHEFNEENNLFVVIMCVPCDSVVVSRKEVVHDDTKQSQSEQKHYSNQEETTSVGHIEEIVSTPTISSQLKISPLKIKPIDKDIADGKESVDTKQSKVEKVDEQKRASIATPLEKPSISTSYEVKPLKAQTILPTRDQE